MQLLFKYPVRLALNPVFSTIGWLLPAIFAGEVLISIVLSVPSIGRCPALNTGARYVPDR